MSQSYTLYWDRETGAFVVEAMLAMASAPYEAIRVDMAGGAHRQPPYTDLNPLARVPTLVLPDGTVLTESAALVLHLIDRFPEAGFAPPLGTPARPTVYRWLIFLATDVYDADLRYYRPATFTADPTGADAVKSAADAQLTRDLALVEQALTPGPFLLGPTMSAADLYLAMVAQWAPEQARRPGVRAVIDAVRAHPIAGEVWRRYND
jgi:glutathione S-transferase